MPDYLPTLADAPLAAAIPGEAERRQRERIAAALLQQGGSGEPIAHWAQGLNRVAQGLIGGYQLGELRRQGEEERARTQAIFKNLPDFTGAQSASTVPPQRAAETAPPAAAPVAPDPSTLPTNTFAERFAGEPPQAAAAPAPARAGPQLLAAIKGFEGYSPTAYADYKQYSVGYGTRAASPNERITPDVAEARLSEEVGKAAAIVDKFKPDLPPGVRDALVSLTYNAGDSWTKSGLGQAVQKGDYGAAQQIFQQYNRAGGQVLPGLASRRQQEAQWFDRGATPGQPPMASRSDAIPPAIQQEIQFARALAQNPPTAAAGAQMYFKALEKAQAWQQAQLPTVKEYDPDKPPMSFDPRTQTMKPITVVGGEPKPSGPIQAEVDRLVAQGADRKTAKVEATKRFQGENLPTDVAGKIAMMETAQAEMKNYKGVLTGDWDAEKIKQYYAAKVGVGAAAGEIGTARRAVRGGIEGALRIMTGAAAPDPEVKRYEDMYMPTPLDNAQSREQKLRMLDGFMRRANALVRQGRTMSLDEVNKEMTAANKESIAAPRDQGGGNAEDKRALDWANRNPNDPRAARIKQQLGVP